MRYVCRSFRNSMLNLRDRGCHPAGTRTMWRCLSISWPRTNRQGAVQRRRPAGKIARFAVTHPIPLEYDRYDRRNSMTDAYVLPLDQLRMQDVASVGGKNASLGEMINQLSHLGIRVPGGFATTAQAYRDFLAQDGLARRIDEALKSLDVDDVRSLAKVGASVRGWILEAPLPARMEAEIREAYQGLRENGG